ncbi:hypothetical protein EDC96DRAFT_547250 [Choanephora cucurbitarum]|nr:hypothetical protein EDC96DRAFT_547250 [Choanephora cucurbitarum]
MALVSMNVDSYKAFAQRISVYSKASAILYEKALEGEHTGLISFSGPADDTKRTVVACGNAHIRIVAERAIVIPVDEFRTSATCCRCHQRLDLVRASISNLMEYIRSDHIFELKLAALTEDQQDQRL